jgi:hypothetical protein
MSKEADEMVRKLILIPVVLLLSVAALVNADSSAPFGF